MIERKPQVDPLAESQDLVLAGGLEIYSGILSVEYAYLLVEINVPDIETDLPEAAFGLF